MSVALCINTLYSYKLRGIRVLLQDESIDLCCCYVVFFVSLLLPECCFSSRLLHNCQASKTANFRSGAVATYVINLQHLGAELGGQCYFDFLQRH
jgi:hypothetical protein